MARRRRNFLPPFVASSLHSINLTKRGLSLSLRPITLMRTLSLTQRAVSAERKALEQPHERIDFASRTIPDDPDVKSDDSIALQVL